MPKDKNLIISNKNAGSSSNAVSDSTVKAFSFNDDVLKLFNIRETQVEEFKISSEKDELHVQITLNRDDCSCPMCRSKEIKVKGYKIKKVRHSVLAHAPCIIDYKQRRYECKNCGNTFNEENSFTFPGEKVSVTTVFLVLKDLRDPNETFTSVATRYFLSPTTVQRIFDAHVNIPRRKLTSYLIMDENSSFHSSQGDYIYVLMDFETLAIIDILPSRKKKYNKVFKQYLNYFDIYYMILDIDDELIEAVALQECLYAFFRKNDLKTAAKALKELIANFHTSQVKEMNDFANTLANWKQEILNYFYTVQTGEDFIIDDYLNNAETELIKNFIAEISRKR